jgi:predicted dehydrogenase
MQHAIEYLRGGNLGDVRLVRVMNMKTRPGIPGRPDAPAPKGLDYDRWLGPAPQRPYNPNVTGRWNWFWDFSGGDIVNDGIHHMDLARWVIGKPYPKSVVTTGGNLHFDDAAETPDTQVVHYEYDKLILEFEMTLWTPYIKKIPMDIRNGDRFPNWPMCATRIEVYGTKGMMMIGRHGGGWQVFLDDEKGEPFEYGREPSVEHVENFVQCVRSRKRPNADIEEGHLSTLLCHLGNISYRVGNRRLHFDAKTETFIDAPDANRLVKRTYRKPYVVPETV